MSWGSNWVSPAVYSASAHFGAKDFETSAEMFEKSMLYIPHDIENRVFRAKGFRVLCLCYLGLSQLDRAHEYIEEAEKVHYKRKLLCPAVLLATLDC